MEFTKIEQRILSTKHEYLQKLLLWLGIFFFIFSIALVPYTISQIKKVEKSWEESYSFLNQKIKPETKQEVLLKSMLLENIGMTKKIILSGLKQKMAGESMHIFFIGCWFVLIYFISRNYIRLIRKLQSS